MVLPRSVLRLDGSILIVGEDRKLQIRQVKVLRTDEHNVYVSSGISQGELVTISAVSNPYNGMPVRLPTDLPAPEDAKEDSTTIASSGGDQ